ncbi:cortical protein marker for cell polarity-domain-containing protein [Parasitella parasitica]|nr:cortical protein marker for cell polarity-domain-containing protein [Parasitella parasitica]
MWFTVVFLSLLLLEFVKCIDIDEIGQLGFAGNYAGISNVKSNNQFESIDSTNLIQQKDDVFEKIATFSGNITAYCSIENDIYLGGYFKTVNETLFNHIVKYNTQSNQFQPLAQGLNGSVYSLYCDEIDNVVYVGGNFTGNAIQWDTTNNQWVQVPWKGFNGPVYTITKNKKYSTILFGGRFDATSDGQFFNSNTSQLVPLSSPTSISSGNGALSGSFNDPNNIVCPAKPSPESEGNPWYLQDSVPGYWDANFINPIEPTVFRLSNTHTDRGTISFNILALGSNEYFNLSFVDPVSQQVVQCSTNCILSNDTFQDFTVVGSMKSSGIRININSWYGDGGGLGYVQVFQSDISVNPHLNTNNDPRCNPSASSTQTTITGNWQDVYVYGYYQTVLEANMPFSELATSNLALVYEPNIPAQGQYDIYATTPGCVGSSNCFQRTQVEYQLQLSPGVVTTIVSNQNTFSDRRTLLYSGFISPVSSTFRPSITLKPATNATKPDGDDVSIMADTIEFVRNVTAPPLVSILEYTPSLNNASNGTAISWKPLNQQLSLGSTVYSIDTSDGDLLYIGGQFNSPANAGSTGFQNIVSYNKPLGQLIPLDNESISGLNGKVSKLILHAATLYVGGEFNSTISAGNANISNFALFDTVQKTWKSLGNGVDGPVDNLILSTNNDTLTVSGSFRHKLTPDPRLSIGNALWGINKQSWIERESLIVGNIAADVVKEQRYFAGTLLGAQTYRADLVTSSNLTASSVVLNQSSIITAGVTWMNNQTRPFTPVTIIAAYSNNNTTVYMYNNTAWTLIDVFNGKVNTLAAFENKLFVGGQFPSMKSRSASLAMYNLADNNRLITVSGPLDPNGNPGVVNTIKIHPDGKRIMIGGQFTRVGFFDCVAICIMDPNIRQWNNMALGLAGTINDIITYPGQDVQKVTVVGNLQVQSNFASLATLSGIDTLWTSQSLTDQLPGIPTTAVNAMGSEILIAGTSSSDYFVGSVNEGKFTSLAANLGPGTNISRLLLVPVKSSTEERFPADTKNMLLAVGHLNVNSFGNASAALYDGSKWSPYLLTTQLNGRPGIIYQVIHTTDFNGIKKAHKYLSVAAVILISIAISTAILFTMSAAGFLYLFKKHKAAQGPNAMPPWTPSNRLFDTFGIFNTGTLGASAIAATAPVATTAAATLATSRSVAGPSNTTSRTIFTHDDGGDLGVFPSTTIGKPLPISAAAAAAGILSFDAMVASAKASHAGAISENNPKLFHAKYPFKAQEYGELSLDAGDTIVVTDTTDDIWWLGYKDSGTNRPLSGVFPSNYVQA